MKTDQTSEANHALLMLEVYGRESNKKWLQHVAAFLYKMPENEILKYIFYQNGHS
jgi:endoglucanase Acf2